jgi:Arc/MetJ-type ribon-helix-helix transcriptional regulator
MPKETKQERKRKERYSVCLCCASGNELAEAIERALENREHVVMVRVNDEILKHLDMLVESGICKSRSGAATFMIREGIKANQGLFDRIKEIAQEIMNLKEQLKRAIEEERR